MLLNILTRHGYVFIFSVNILQGVSLQLVINHNYSPVNINVLLSDSVNLHNFDAVM